MDRADNSPAQRDPPAHRHARSPFTGTGTGTHAGQTPFHPACHRSQRRLCAAQQLLPAPPDTQPIRKHTMTVIVTAIFTPKDGAFDDVVAALSPAIAEVHDE